MESLLLRKIVHGLKQNRRGWAIFFWVTSFMVFVYSSSSDAVERLEDRLTSVPPSLNQKQEPQYFYCGRNFIYRGKLQECDSNLGKDGSHLRPIIKDIPNAVVELDLYQKNREKIRTAAYFGAVGLLVGVIGVLVSHPPFDQNTGVLKPGGYALFGGGLLTVGSFIYGLVAVNQNESHLTQAIQHYNTAYPEDPIKIQVTTGIDF